MSVTSLVIDSKSFLFNHEEFKELKDTLKHIEGETVITPCTSQSDIMLSNETGRTLNGFTYSAEALTQICMHVASGLSVLMQELTGRWRKVTNDRRNYSVTAAVDIFNKIIRLRFDQSLIGLQLVKNTKTKTIDGIVGHGYRYISNGEFLDRIMQATKIKKIKFYEACLYGRSISLRFLDEDEKNAFKVGDDKYHNGFHFLNSEVGKQSVVVVPALVRLTTGDTALSVKYKTRRSRYIIHAGNTFDKRLYLAIEGLIRYRPDVKQYTTCGERLLKTSLNLGGTDHRQRLHNLAQVLSKNMNRTSMAFMEKVLLNTIRCGSGIEEKINNEDLIFEDRQKLYASRNVYDLFTNLIHYARALPLNKRMTVEQIAYLIFTNRFGFGL